MLYLAKKQIVKISHNKNYKKKFNKIGNIKNKNFDIVFQIIILKASLEFI